MFRQRIEIIASPSYVWDVMVDFANWPQWTPTVSQLTVLTHGEPGVGTSVSIKQPTLPASTWTVTEWRNRSFFTWVWGSAPKPAEFVQFR